MTDKEIRQAITASGDGDPLDPEWAERALSELLRLRAREAYRVHLHGCNVCCVDEKGKPDPSCRDGIRLAAAIE